MPGTSFLLLLRDGNQEATLIMKGRDRGSPRHIFDVPAAGSSQLWETNFDSESNLALRGSHASSTTVQNSSGVYLLLSVFGRLLRHTTAHLTIRETSSRSGRTEHRRRLLWSDSAVSSSYF